MWPFDLLSGNRGEPNYQRLVQQAQSQNERTRKRALEKLRANGSDSALGALTTIAAGAKLDDRTKKESVYEAIGGIENPDSYESLIENVANYQHSPDSEMITRPKRDLAEASLRAIGNIGDRRSVTFLANALKNVWSEDESDLRAPLCNAFTYSARKFTGLPEISGHSPCDDASERFDNLDGDLVQLIVPVLVDIIIRHDPGCEQATERALQFLAALSPRASVPLLISTLHINLIQPGSIRIFSACQLGKVRAKQAVDRLLDALDITHAYDTSLKFAAAKALAQIAGLPGADALPIPPQFWKVDMKKYEPEFNRLLKEAKDHFQPSYRRNELASGVQVAEGLNGLSPHHALVLSEACRAFDEMRILKISDHPANRQNVMMVNSMRKQRIREFCEGKEEDWVFTVRDFPGYAPEFLRYLEARIIWGDDPIDDDGRARILQATAREEAIKGMLKSKLFEKVNDKDGLAGFLLMPFARDLTIVLQPNSAATA